MSTTSSENAVLEPHLSEFGRGAGQNRYPNPFFDLAQQYTPRTVKELFRWCTYFYYSNPLVGSTITKISRYPITDIIIEDTDSRVKESWETIFNDNIKIKDRLMEVNLDLNVYGNSFVSMSLPFTRYLICEECSSRHNIDDLAWEWRSYNFSWVCPKCKAQNTSDTETGTHIKDIPYRAKEEMKMIRWNPENIAIRYNEATGETHYFYNVSRQLRYQITSGEKEIIQTLPLLFIQAVKKSRLIKLSTQNIFHLKRPTLAEKDMGWGKPLIQHVMKDLYYMATLRRAQEAIAQEHIVPFDFLFPQPNAQMDPFVHSDLGNWRNRVEEIVSNRKRDPNYKAILPVPIGFGRIGGDGKSLMLTPELNHLSQVIVGGMGIPQEFLFGGLNWTGSSITLRSLQNDFQHNQTQLLELTRWVKEKIRIFLKIPDVKKVRFMDFKMADDIQRIQQLISLNAQRKVSDETMLTELGLDYEKEVSKIMQELEVQNQMQDRMARSQAKTSGESQIISYNYQQKIQELQQKAQEKQIAQGNAPGMEGYGGPETASGMEGEQSGLGPQAGGGAEPGMEEQAQEAAGQVAPPPEAAGDAALEGQYVDNEGQQVPGAAPSETAGGQTAHMDVHKTIRSWASKLVGMEMSERQRMLTQIKQQMPTFGRMVEEMMNEQLAGGGAVQGAPGAAGGGSAGQSNPNAGQVNMNAMPEKGAPTRAGSA